jgi:hypothetical protein
VFFQLFTYFLTVNYVMTTCSLKDQRILRPQGSGGQLSKFYLEKMNRYTMIGK